MGNDRMFSDGDPMETGDYDWSDYMNVGSVVDMF